MVFSNAEKTHKVRKRDLIAVDNYSVAVNWVNSSNEDAKWPWI